jgi:uncharacterized membrane protein YqiK
MRALADAEATKARSAAQAEATRLNAPADAEKISRTGLAETEKSMAIGKSTAEACKLQVKAMGGDNFTRFKITEEIGKGHIKIIPGLVLNGNAGATDGSLSGLMGLQLLDMLKGNNNRPLQNQNPSSSPQPVTAVARQRLFLFAQILQHLCRQLSVYEKKPALYTFPAHLPRKRAAAPLP